MSKVGDTVKNAEKKKKKIDAFCNIVYCLRTGSVVYFKALNREGRYIEGYVHFPT